MKMIVDVDVDVDGGGAREGKMLVHDNWLTSGGY